MNDVHMSSQIGYDENNVSPRIQYEPIHVQKRKTIETRTSNLKTERKSSRQIKGAVRLSMQIGKLCCATDNMSHATSNLTPVTYPFDIPQKIKMLDELIGEIPKTSQIYIFTPNLIKIRRIELCFYQFLQILEFRGDSMNNINNSNDDE
ncbi:hypothetical protein GQ457_06G014890 [Hibiscus cannabinus]